MKSNRTQGRRREKPCPGSCAKKKPLKHVRVTVNRLGTSFTPSGAAVAARNE